MTRLMRSWLLLAACVANQLLSSHAFCPSTKACASRSVSLPPLTATKKTNQDDDATSSSRRDFFRSSVGEAAATALAWNVLTTQPSLAEENVSKAKVLVLGGSGFVGSRVVATLQDLGVSTVATSRNGRDGTVALDVTTENNVSNKIAKLAQGCTAVISCIGAIGTDQDEVVNGATAAAATGAKAAGVSRFVYITVAPEVKDFARNVEFLQGYIKGKALSRDAVLNTFGDAATLIEPTFIYGGGSFELNPPRVASFYGKFIEGLLSSSPVRAVNNITPAGLIKIALEPPVPVDAVARAAVAGALGKAPPILDTYDKIKKAASLVDE